MESAEHSAIVKCLGAIRWRLWSVRLAERVTVALAWGCGIAVALTAARLLREYRLPRQNTAWIAPLVALLPLFAAAQLWRLAPRLRRMPGTLSPALIRLGAILTALCSVLVLVSLYYTPVVLPAWSVPAGVGCLFFGAALATVRLIDARAAAIFVDQQVGLHERVSTALEILQAAKPTSELEARFHAPVISSALAACKTVSTARVGYSRLDRRAYAVAALVAVGAACMTLVPPVPAQARTTRQPSITVVRQAKDLQQILKELQEKNPQAAQEHLKPLQTAIQQLKDGTTSPIETSAALSEAKAELQKEKDALAASDKVQEMLRNMQGMEDLTKAAQATRDAEMKQNQGDPAAREQKAAAQNALKQAASSLATKAAGMSESDKKQLADNLQSAADKAGADPQLKQNLQSAADAARSGDSEKLASSMEKAGERMGDQQADSQASQESINRAMAQIDQMQGQGSEGSQSTMGSSGSPGDGQQNQGGQQSAQGNQNGGGQGGGQNQEGGAGQNGQSGGQAAGEQGGQGGAGGGQTSASNNGSTLFDNPGAPGSKDHGPVQGTGTFVRIYDQRINQSAGNKEKIGSFINPLGAASGSTDVLGPADQGDSTIKAYSDVLPELRQRNMDEINRQEYPPQYQEIVRRFYDAPQNK